MLLCFFFLVVFFLLSPFLLFLPLSFPFSFFFFFLFFPFCFFAFFFRFFSFFSPPFFFFFLSFLYIRRHTIGRRVGIFGPLGLDIFLFIASPFTVFHCGGFLFWLFLCVGFPCRFYDWARDNAFSFWHWSEIHAFCVAVCTGHPLKVGLLEILCNRREADSLTDVRHDKLCSPCRRASVITTCVWDRIFFSQVRPESPRSVRSGSNTRAWPPFFEEPSGLSVKLLSVRFSL